MNWTFLRRHLLVMAFGLALLLPQAAATVATPVMRPLGYGRNIAPPFQLAAASAQDLALQKLLSQLQSLIEAGQVAQAEQVLAQADAMAKKINSSGGMILVRQSRAELDMKEGRFDLAEPLLKGVLADIGKRSGTASPFNVEPMQDLATIYLRQNQLDLAANFINQALAIVKKAYGANSGQVAELENTLGIIWLSEGKPQTAEPLLTDAVKIFGKVGDALAAAQTQDSLAALYGATGRDDLARTTYVSALAAETKAVGPENAISLKTENNLAVLDRNTGNYAAAETGFNHVLSVYEKLLGSANPDVLQLQNNVAWLKLASGDDAAALAGFRSAFAGYSKLRVTQAHDYSAGQSIGVGDNEVGRTILGLLATAWDLSAKQPQQAAALREEAFAASQAVHRSEAANALAQTSARILADNPQLSDLVRQEQNLATQWRQLNAELTQELSVAAQNRNPQAEAQAQQSLDNLNAQITTLDQKITAAFPRYSTLVDPPPASIADVQKWLHPDEVLAEFVTFGGSQGNGTYLFLISASSSKWTYIKAGAIELAQSVMTMRCGLDSDAWDGAGAKTCQQLAGANTGELPPFNHQAAKDLFDTLFGDVRADLANKSVILVLPEPLSSLPFQALINGPFDKTHRKTIPWFGRTNPISVVPSVASLGALRQPKITRAPEPYIGFGDPLLAGNSTCAPDLSTFSGCPTPQNLKTIAAGNTGTLFESLARNAAMPSMQKVFQGGRIDLAQLHAQCPLPETEFQLRCTATSLNVPQSTVHIQADATVTAVEQAPLNRYRIIVFATHGLLSSDTQSLGGNFEPALLLTPPTKPSGDDQGLLTASIISHLNLNADWVLLTACNTGEPGSGGEAMSGLASAFLYAGAHTVLASHWAVLETSTVLLASDAFIQIGENPSISRAEAMRRAMIALMDDDDTVMSHPTAWAPFTIVGESGPL